MFLPEMNLEDISRSSKVRYGQMGGLGFLFHARCVALTEE